MSGTLSATAAAAGRYRVQVHGVGQEAAMIAARDAVPESYRKPYRLTVTQP